MTTITPRTPRRASLLAALLLLAAGLCAPAFAQQGAGGPPPPQVTARLIEASSDNQPNSPELADVLPLLQELLRFNSYQMVCSRNFPVTEGLRVKLEHGQTFVVSNVKGNEFTVSVDRGGKTILSMRVKMEPGRPVVFAVPSTRGHSYFIVLTAR
jgi:hypothetical protein